MSFLIALLVSVNIFLNQRQWRTLMAKISDAVTDLQNLTAQVERNRQEVLAKIAVLEAAAGNDTTPEFDAALADLKAKVQTADDDVTA
jgi:vacuolar-type H+-ATPase subunit D/Vma8